MSYRVKQLNQENEQLSHQMSTGKQIISGSDDSRLYARDLDIKDKIRIYEGLEEQITNTVAFNEVSDVTVDQIKEQVSSLKDAVQSALGNDQLRGEAERETNKATLKSIRDTLLTLANTEINGEYLFSGVDTTIKPIEGEDDADFEETGQISYVGREEARVIAVEPKIYRDRGVTGKDLFFVKNYFEENEQISFDRGDVITDSNDVQWRIDETVPQLISPSGNTKAIEFVDASKKYLGYQTVDSLGADEKFKVEHNYFDDIQTAIMALDDRVYDYGSSDGNPDTVSYIDGNPDDYTEILNHVLGKMDDADNTVTIAHAKLGSRNKVFDLAQIRVEDKITHYTIFEEEITGVDYAQASMKLTSLELTYQAMFSTITKLNEMTLVNFIK
jgi:flagellar hook-associated protein 3 FlgL